MQVFMFKKSAYRLDVSVYHRFEEPGVTVLLGLCTKLALLLQKEGKLMELYIIVIF